MENKSYREIYGEILGSFYENGFISGRMISHSKSFYKKNFPNSQAYFNANVFVLGEGKVWWGDLDLTIDTEVLERISIACGKKLYIVPELYGRFEYEDASDEHVIRHSVAVIG